MDMTFAPVGPTLDTAVARMADLAPLHPAVGLIGVALIILLVVAGFAAADPYR